MSDKAILFDLKEKAKWSHNPEEKIAAIKELSAKGANALPQLEEIFSITAYEEIRNACAEAIRTIRVAEGENTDTNMKNMQAGESLSLTPEKTQKKEEKEGESASESGIRLADLPP